MDAIESAKKILKNKINILEEKYPEITKYLIDSEPDIEKNLHDIEAIEILKNNKAKNLDRNWHKIRKIILSVQARIYEQEERLKLHPENKFYFNQLAVYCRTLNDFIKIIDLAQEYIKHYDPELLNPKSRSKIRFLSEQLLVQPLKNHRESTITPKKSSYYWQKSTLQKGMNKIMRMMRGFDKIDKSAQCQTSENISHKNKQNKNNQNKKNDILYVMDDVIKRQPTFYSCSDTSAAMINHFQKLKLPTVLNKILKLNFMLLQLKQKINHSEKVEKIEYTLNSYRAHIQKMSDELNKSYHTTQNKPLTSGFRTDNEIMELYHVHGSLRNITYKEARKSPEARKQFLSDLSQHLYEVGPITAEINTGSPFNNHAIVVNGIIGENICYIDSWNGQAKEMNVHLFVKQMRSSDLGGIFGMSYSLMDELEDLEKKINTAMAEASKNIPEP